MFPGFRRGSAWIASIRWLLTAVWWLSREQYGVVWRMMVALLVVSGSLDGSVAGCERVLDVSVLLDVDVVVVVKQQRCGGSMGCERVLDVSGWM